MRLVLWAALFTAGVATGALSCAALVVRRRVVPLVGLAATVAGLSALAVCAAIFQQTNRLDTFIAAIFITLGASVGGYALASALIPTATSFARTAPVLLTPPADEGRIGVVLLAESEPEDYDPRALTALLRAHEEAGAPLPPELAKPLVYAAERSRYARIGASPARTTVDAIAASLQERLRAAGADADVLTATCDDGSLRAAVSALSESRHRRIVVALLTVARTQAFASALGSVTARDASAVGLLIEMTDPLWSSETLVRMVASRIIEALADGPADGGVCLVAQGTPVEIEKHFPDAAEQLTFFAERVRAEVVRSGIAPERIRRGWLQWEEPDVSEASRHLSAVGAQRIVFAPLSFPTESTQTLLDLRYAAEQTAEDTGSATVVLAAWDDDPAIAESLAERVLAAVDRLRDEARARH